MEHSLQCSQADMRSFRYFIGFSVLSLLTYAALKVCTIFFKLFKVPHVRRGSGMKVVASEFIPLALFTTSIAWGVLFRLNVQGCKRIDSLGVLLGFSLPLIACISCGYPLYVHMQTDVSLSFTVLLRGFRRDLSFSSTSNFAVGAAAQALVTVIWHKDFYQRAIMDVFVEVLFVLILRGSALPAFLLVAQLDRLWQSMIPRLQRCYQQEADCTNLCVLIGLTSVRRLSGLWLMVAASHAGTCCDARRVALLCMHMCLCAQMGSHTAHLALDGDTLEASLAIPFLLVATHVLTVYCGRERAWPSWADGIRFLKVSELQKLHPRVLVRQQPVVFGDARTARYLICVSHPWLSREHADPDGVHLEYLLRVLKDRLLPVGRQIGLLHSMANLWRRYYFWHSGGDVLIFFDMASLPQNPRSEEENSLFKNALKHITLLYSILPVLVIPEIPAHVTMEGQHITYQEKGWCWGELNTANVRGQLDLLSSDVLQELGEEELITDDRQWLEHLMGKPALPQELYSDLPELLRVRETQKRKCKVFTCGKVDCNRVQQQLSTHQAKTLLQESIVAKDETAVKDLLLSEHYQVLGYTCEHLVNEVLDSNFTTPLHLAVSVGHNGIVMKLLKAGAIPARNYRGDYPWECWGLPRMSGAAFMLLRFYTPSSAQTFGHQTEAPAEIELT